MQIGEVIRKYRKELNLTQEEMAKRLGVTTPAVNKWENGNSYPDIMLLAPIARLLGIDLDTLLAYQEDLTEQEILNLVKEIDEKLKKEPFEQVFQWAKEIIACYPNSVNLIWQMAVILDAWQLIKKVPDSHLYEQQIIDWYRRGLESTDEDMRTRAAESLYSYYVRKEQYETAEQYLTYFSNQNPERKRKQAELYRKTNQIDKAYEVYEQLLLSGYQITSMVLNGLYQLTIEENDLIKAHWYVEKQQALARLFEMGRYHEVSCELELAVLEENTDEIQHIKKEMLESLNDITCFTRSPLYEHMQFQSTDSNFNDELKKNLLESFESIQ